MDHYEGLGHPHAMPRRDVNPAFSRKSRPFGRLARVTMALTLAAGGALLAAPAATAASGTGQAYVIQGLLGETYDIAVDGEVVHKGAGPKAIVGPIGLAAGTHVVALKKGSTTAIQTRFTVHGGQSVDVVAHKRADSTMSPVITAFRNDTSPVGPGKLRLTVAHTAAAPPADIRVDGEVLFRNVANAEALTLLVPAKTYTVDIVPAATNGQPILGPVDLPLKAGTLTRVFAIGSVTSNTMDAVVQSLPVKVSGAKAPGSVHTGDGGQAATGVVGGGPKLPTVALVTALGAVLLAATGGGALVRRNLRLRSQ
jgi:hypothetical protein